MSSLNNINNSNKYFSYNKGKIYNEVSGNGNKEFIIFIHGFALDHRLWNGQVQVLSGKYRILTYDMRGFGKSSIPVAAYSHHDDLLNLLDYHKISKCNLVGLSLGGEVAIDFAISYPGRIKKLVLMDSSLGGYKSTVNWDVGAKELGIERAKKNWLSHEVFATIRNDEDLFKELKWMCDTYSGWHWVNKDPRDRLNPSAKERLNEIKAECQILVGEKDLGYFHDISKVLEKNISNSKKIVIENAGHLVNMEMSKIVNETLLRFINSKKLTKL